jgi:hypothetical protein
LNKEEVRKCFKEKEMIEERGRLKEEGKEPPAAGKAGAVVKKRQQEAKGEKNKNKFRDII